MNLLGFDKMEVFKAERWKCGIAFLWKENLGWEVFYMSNGSWES